MRVVLVAADQIRSLNGVSLRPAPGVTVIIGPNGTGKTNLIEAIYFGLTARSFRTSDRRDLIPFGSTWARSRVEIEAGQGGDHVTHRFMAGIDRSEGSRFTLDGAAVEQREATRHRPAVVVFSPDRLELIKGPPAVRRNHLDGFVAALWPQMAALRTNFGRALAQRNALLARMAEGRADRDQLSTWDRQVAETGAALAVSRSQAVEVLSDQWQQATEDLGLEGETEMIYRPGGPLDAGEIEVMLSERIESDLRLGRTGAGPHHDEVRFQYRGRQLRRFGSQGQQRLGMLALQFAEREALLAQGWPSPLMLLDDVMSELDADRRSMLIDRLNQAGQAIITAAEGELVPPDPDVMRIDIGDLTRQSPTSPAAPDA